VQHVLIIGGGGAGPALFLQRTGIACAVYEARASAEGVGGGLNLAPNGMHVLAQVGVAATIQARGT
jgi:2-polyprenyl-6-methoxyphenol hydroxylase-like FAD-dependent oxidoreductase